MQQKLYIFLLIFLIQACSTSVPKKTSGNELEDSLRSLEQNLMSRGVGLSEVKVDSKKYLQGDIAYHAISVRSSSPDVFLKNQKIIFEEILKLPISTVEHLLSAGQFYFISSRTHDLMPLLFQAINQNPSFPKIGVAVAGTWEGETTEDGKLIKQTSRRTDDGNITIEFKLYKKNKLINSQVEEGYWWQIKSYYITRTQLKNASPHIYTEVYKITRSDENELEYESLRNHHRFIQKRAP
ncbi:MAG: hypothetical protein AB7I27_19555 [Bacteriovoracaceae bacterium]